MFRVLLSGRGGLYIFSQGGLEAGKTAVLLSAGVRPPAGVDRRGRRRSSRKKFWMFRVLLSGRGGLYIFSQGGLEAGKTAVLLSAGVRPPAGVDRRGRRRSGSFGVWFRFFS